MPRMDRKIDKLIEDLDTLQKIKKVVEKARR